MAEDLCIRSSNKSIFLCENVKRTRKSGSRSKTGCITCRLRRVKCDELKPACQRCTNAQRKCEGYPSIFAVTKPWEVVMDPALGSIIKPSTNPRVASNDHALRTFQFFQQQSVCKLAEVFGKELWTEAVPRAALHCPEIWHATIAVGSAHEVHWLKNLGPGVHDSKTEWTLGQYNRAIRALTHPSGGQGPSPEVMITVSLLFMAFEMLRGEPGKAIAHAKSGMSMYREYRRKLASDDGYNPGESIIPLSYLERSLRQVEIQLCEFPLDHYPTYPLPTVSLFDRQVMPHSYSLQPETETKFRDLAHARVALGLHWHSLMDKLHFDTVSQVYGPVPYCDGIDGLRESYYQALSGWSKSFGTLVTELNARSTRLTSLERGSIARLQMYELLLLQVLETHDFRDEMVWDRFTERYNRILDLCRITASNDEFGDPACDMIRVEAYCGFQLGNGIVAACFHVIWKCRSARIRQKGLEILRAYPRREALWDARLVVAVGELLDELERGPGQLSDAADRDTGPEEIPPWARVRCIDVQFTTHKRSAELSFVKPKSKQDDTLIDIKRTIAW